MKLFSRLKTRREGSGGEGYRYPLHRENHRIFPANFSGLICIWDIDKTYLASDIDSLRGMLKIPFEFAIDKRTVAGADNLLRLLRRPAGSHAPSGLYFVSASPNQLRKTIEKKMLLDAVEHDGITLKDWTSIVKSGRLTKLREQIGYKLSALLLGRLDLGCQLQEILFGDDSEADALIYSLYADICAGRLRDTLLKETLLKNGVAVDDAGYIQALTKDLPPHKIVQRIYIHTERESSAEKYDAWKSPLVACQDTFQMTIMLVAEGHLGDEALVSQARALNERHAFSKAKLTSSMEELIKREWLRVPEKTDLEEVVDTLLSVPCANTSDTMSVHEWTPREVQEGFVTPEGFLA